MPPPRAKMGAKYPKQTYRGEILVPHLRTCIQQRMEPTFSVHWQRQIKAIGAHSTKVLPCELPSTWNINPPRTPTYDNSTTIEC